MKFSNFSEICYLRGKKPLFLLYIKKNFFDILYHDEMALSRQLENLANEAKSSSLSMGHFLYLQRRPPLATVDLSTDRGYWLEERRAYLTVENDGCCLQLVTVVYRGHQWFFPKSASPTSANTIVRSRSGWTSDVTRIRACETYKIDLSLSCLAAVWTVDCHRGKYYYLPRIPAADYRFRGVSH